MKKRLSIFFQKIPAQIFFCQQGLRKKFFFEHGIRKKSAQGGKQVQRAELFASTLTFWSARWTF